MSTLEDEVLRWADETRSLLVSVKRVVEYFGDDDEYESLLAALVFSESFFEGVIPAFRDPHWRASTTGTKASKFKCRRPIAAMITPLLQVIVEPVPEFVPSARQELEPAHFSALMRHVGGFTGSLSMDVCATIWQDFPDLAPEGWPGLGPRESSRDLKTEEGPADDSK